MCHDAYFENSSKIQYPRIIDKISSQICIVIQFYKNIIVGNICNKNGIFVTYKSMLHPEIRKSNVFTVLHYTRFLRILILRLNHNK